MFKKNPKIDAKSYIHTRKVHKSELAEDYVELIEDLNLNTRIWTKE